MPCVHVIQWITSAVDCGAALLLMSGTANVTHARTILSAPQEEHYNQNQCNVEGKEGEKQRPSKAKQIKWKQRTHLPLL